MKIWGREVRRRLLEAEKCLERLLSINPKYTVQYFEGQWERQKTLQKATISESAKEKRERLSVLLNLEENSHEARWVIVGCVSSQIQRSLLLTNTSKNSEDLNRLNAQTVRTRTAEQRRAVLSLPSRLTVLETKMQALADQLGSNEFLHLTGSSVKI